MNRIIVHWTIHILDICTVALQRNAEDGDCMKTIKRVASSITIDGKQFVKEINDR